MPTVNHYSYPRVGTRQVHGAGELNRQERVLKALIGLLELMPFGNLGGT
jgi:hypothetical protein